MFSKEKVLEWLRSFQNDFCAAMEQHETSEKKFQKNRWQRPGGGGGESRVLQFGDCFEKAGVNFSEVYGELPESLKEKLQTTETKFFATGVSIVIHPFSPQVPTFHANFRYFEQKDRAWFGGGADLTPYVYDEELFQLFHQYLKRACDAYRQGAYAEYKKICDQYFFIPHRDEARGIGGIFFDYLSEDLPKAFDFVKSSGAAILEAYPLIVEKTKLKPFNKREKEFQLLRRGRYVEFNLVYDRGTKFGLETKGNIEGILMSLPARVHYEYQASMEETESERNLMTVFRKARDWV